MVLASLGVNRSEEELRIATDCGYAGARGLAIVDAARSEGFTQTKKANLNIEELRGEVERGLFPIAYVVTNPSSWLTEPHAVVVIEVNDNYVTMLDPADDERSIPISEFVTAWERTRGRTILVE